MTENEYRLMTGKMYALGLRERHKGTAMLRTAVELYEPGMFFSKDLYPAVAKRHGTTPAAAERAMRIALQDRGCCGSITDAAQFFGHVDGVSISDFVARMHAFIEIGV